MIGDIAQHHAAYQPIWSHHIERRREMANFGDNRRASFDDMIAQLNSAVYREFQTWMQTQPDLRTAWMTCDRPQWMTWMMMYMDIPWQASIHIACRFAREILLPRVPFDEERPRLAIEATEAYLRGEIDADVARKSASDARAAGDEISHRSAREIDTWMLVLIKLGHASAEQMREHGDLPLKVQAYLEASYAAYQAANAADSAAKGIYANFAAESCEFARDTNTSNPISALSHHLVRIIREHVSIEDNLAQHESLHHAIMQLSLFDEM